jgi:hypothetical protein
VMLTLAAFSRESLLLVPATILVRTIWCQRDRAARMVAPLVVPFICWGTWIAWVRLRVGEWPGAANRIAPPFLGLVRAISDWHDHAANLLVIGLGVAFVTALAGWRTSDLVGIVALAHVLLAAIAGSDVWQSWVNFSRPLLPLYVFGLISLASRPNTQPIRPPEPTPA